MTKVGFRALAGFSMMISLSACGGEQDASRVIDRNRFVAANVAVRTLPADATDADRAAALKKHRVSEKDLKAWVNAHSRDPETVSLAWEEIAHKVDSLTTQRPGSPPGAASPPPGPAAAPPRPPRDLPPAVRARKDSLARIYGGRGPGTPRPGGPPSGPPPPRRPSPGTAPDDPRVAPVQPPVAPARPGRREAQSPPEGR